MKSYVSTNRNSSFELLRIIAMLTIIASHYLGHGIGQIADAPPILWSVDEICQLLAKISNNIFFLLTGWFLCRTHFTFKRLMILFGQILFINWLLLIINLSVYEQRDVVMILKQLFHVSSSMNWLLAHTLPFICSGLLFSFIGCILYDSVAIYFFN